MPFYCYILKCTNGAYYTGWSTDPLRRLEQHNTGKGARYTRLNRPVELVYVEEQPNQTSALKREFEIKKWSHSRKKTLVENTTLHPEFQNPDPLDCV